jgi:hypothetical protein
MFVIQNLGHLAHANKIVIPHNNNLELVIKFANFKTYVGVCHGILLKIPRPFNVSIMIPKPHFFVRLHNVC